MWYNIENFYNNFLKRNDTAVHDRFNKNWKELSYSALFFHMQFLFVFNGKLSLWNEFIWYWIAYAIFPFAADVGLMHISTKQYFLLGIKTFFFLFIHQNLLLFRISDIKLYFCGKIIGLNDGLLVVVVVVVVVGVPVPGGGKIIGPNRNRLPGSMIGAPCKFWVPCGGLLTIASEYPKTIVEMMNTTLKKQENFISEFQ